MSLTKVTYSMITGAPVNVLDFGADNTGAIDAGPAIQTALNSGAAVVVFPPGIYKIETKCICTNTALKRIEGYGATIRAAISGSVNSYMFDFGSNSVLASMVGFTFDSSAPATTVTIPWWNGTFTYSYQIYQSGVYLPDGSTIEDCTFKQLETALYIGTYSDFPYDRKTKVLNCRFEQNLVTSTCISCGFVEYSGNTAYFGSEVTFPSCRNVIITNNMMFLPNTPSINVGGSAALPGSYAIISNNIAFGRDPIVVEVGFDNVTITGNQCFLMEGIPQGVGIGVTTNTDGQAVNRVLIANNTISLFADPDTLVTQYAIGIYIDINIDVICKDISISDNLIIGPGNGIIVDGFDATPRIEGLTINNNTIRDIRIRGIIVGNADRVQISNNKLNSNTAVLTTDGIFLNSVVRVDLVNNITEDFLTNHYYFTGVQSDVILDNPLHNAASESLLWGFGTVTGNLVCRNVVFPTGATPALGTWAQGSFVINPLPASAGYFGATCTVSGTPGTWRTYGLIS
jgi:hypothetical protein